MKVRKGDVVLVDFKYKGEPHGTQIRRRPAVVVSDDSRNEERCDLLVVPLSSAGKAAGLRADSVVRCSIIATVPKIWISGKIGTFSGDILFQIEQGIRNAILPSDLDNDDSTSPGMEQA